MKRTLAVLLILTALAAPLFAASVDFGSSYGGAFGFMRASYTSDGGSPASNWLYSYQHQASFEFTRMFENSMGVQVGAAYVIPAVFREYGVDIRPENTVYPNMIKPYASYRYRLALTESAAFELGAGLYGKIGTKLYNENKKYIAFEIGAEADAAFLYIQERGALALGVKVSAPFFSRVREDGQTSGGLTRFGAEIIPYAGIRISLGQANRT